MSSVRAALAVLVCVVAAAAPAEAAQSPLGGGAWSWFGDPRAVTHDERTYVGWVDHEGDIKVSSYDHVTHERVTAVLQARLNRDDHANPSIHVLPGGRLMVFYSRHVGPAMHYRISSGPESVRSWEPPQTVPVNIPGNFGYTYPNPVRLGDENRLYLFWRGGNYNPTYSTLDDGSGEWSPARNLIQMPGERPYVKYAASGDDTIHVAYTNAHPNEFGDVNIYYAGVHDGQIERANGNPIGPLANAPIAPAAGEEIFDEAEQAWVHDVAADPLGRPVIVFATFPSPADHRYWYARWTGSSWVVEDIVTAGVTSMGGSFREDGGSPYYSGGLTLDHEDPTRVYLSRQIAPGSWQVETWETANGGTDWTSQVVSLPEQRNVRPVSPRGMESPFDDALSVIWMRGSYPSYEEYQTSIVATAGEENLPPVADAEPSVRSGRAPLPVHFTSLAADPDGAIGQWQWDFGDGTAASGADVTHTYDAPGRYFPTLTVTDDQGAATTFVEEITVGLRAAPSTHTGGAAGSTVHGAVNPENQQTQWYFDYGPTSLFGARTAPQTLPAGDSLRQVSAALPGLVPGRLYHYRLVAGNGSGTTEGEDRVMVAGSAAGSDAYRDAVLGTTGLAAYWRLGELSGNASHDELGPGSGVFTGRFVLGQPGVLGPLGNTAASFDGLGGEHLGSGPALAGSGTLEGWFRWRAGTAVMRDHTGPSRGWLLTFNSGGTLRYRVGGQGYDTGRPIGQVRDGTWHHLVATKDGGEARLYVDGQLVHSGIDADSDPAALPWHVMRNGSNDAFTDGEADEIALYGRALTPSEVKAHYDVARELATRPLPPETPDPVVDPPAAGTALGGGVLNRAPLKSPPAGTARVRRGTLVVRGAPGTRNRLSARKRGRAWRIADALAPLRAGAGCKRLGPRTVSCKAARVKRIEMHGGAGADTLIVTGRTRAILVGGPGADRLVGGPRVRTASCGASP
jgi:BNR repeat-containing family member/Concanavalin A-like lectin/glucanases superfamily/PKD domain